MSSYAQFRDEALGLIEAHVRSDFSPDDEHFWTGVREAFNLHPEIVNFNNGGCSP